MGIAVADFDDDGDLDLYTTNITDPPPPPNFGTTQYNVLYVNQHDTLGEPVFVDLALERGVEDTYWGRWPMRQEATPWRSAPGSARRLAESPGAATSSQAAAIWRERHRKSTSASATPRSSTSCGWSGRTAGNES